ncbi:replication initiator protein [Nocardia sp. NBC_00508]|uniref:replication initiator n=1 Tax=Nocardia sp. NBC_00508 TaxID=2975992 RepID=UPI002E809EB8|nr:replication initiator [Nocardia sp. NBC_00508]WUD69617.1 replication initiator protein [Nocardia sp. NBC_00508]
MEPTTTDEVVPIRQTAAERRALPDFRDIAHAVADEQHICRRPIPMRAEDPKTLRVDYVGSPCKSTIESVCPACAAKARYLRMTQCNEGWHMDAEPVNDKRTPTQRQKDLIEARSDLFAAYQAAKEDDDRQRMDDAVEDVAGIDRQLRESGFRGRLPDLDAKQKDRRKRSTQRRQDAPDLPRLKVAKTTIGREYAGKYRPSTFVTLTLPSYGYVHNDGAVDSKGKVCGDGSPRDPDSYDYTRAARDIVHFAALFDRWIQNLRRAVGWDVQYFATVEPQRRGAPHLHLAIRGSIPHAVFRAVTAATYHQVWWPRFDAENEVYSGETMPVWDHEAGAFVDPGTGQPLTGWDDALDIIDSTDDLEPAHVVRFGVQVDSKGILGGTPQADEKVRYLTKYLTKSVAEIIEPQSRRAAEHYDRLHAELQHTPCSPRCGVWLRYGIVPKGATAKTQPGRCKGKAHRRDTLGLPGRRVLVSRRWSNKTLPDHKADRAEFVRQTLAAIGIVKPDRSHLIITPVEPGDKNVPPRDHLIMAAVSQRLTWRAEYNNALLAASPPGPQNNSAIHQAAA